MSELPRRALLRGAAVLAGTALITQLAGCSSAPDADDAGVGDTVDVASAGSSDVGFTRTSEPAAPTGSTTPTASPADTTDVANDGTSSGTTGNGSRVLLAYFSRAGENYFHGDRTWLDVGNTEVVAGMIQAAILVDVYRIEAADPYPDEYEATVERNVDEQQADARPAIANPLPDLTGYDTVLLGSPIWNVRPPMIMRTLLDNVDLTDITLHPFVTYAVSGLGRTIDDYTTLAPTATIGDALAVQGETATTADADVTAWLGRIGLLTT